MKPFNVDTEILLKFDDEGFEVVLSVEEARALYEKLGAIFNPFKPISVSSTPTVTWGTTILPHKSTWITLDGSGLKIK